MQDEMGNAFDKHGEKKNSYRILLKNRTEKERIKLIWKFGIQTS
jgi:hypothetical protein